MRANSRYSSEKLSDSVAIERYTGVETIPHLTPRDMTVAGLESVLLGSHAEGVRNILAVTGDPPESGDYPGTHTVYDFDSIGLVELMARLNRGEDFHGRDRCADVVLPGAPSTPPRTTSGSAERFHRRWQVRIYAMTQLLFDLERWTFRQRIGGAWPIPCSWCVAHPHYETLVRMLRDARARRPGVLERYRAAAPRRATSGSRSVELIEARGRSRRAST